MIMDTYSKNNLAPCSELNYESINERCRLQVINIIIEYFTYNNAQPYAERYFWPIVQKKLKDEHGRESLYREDLHKAIGGNR